MDFDAALLWLAALSSAAVLVRTAPLLRQGRGQGWMAVGAAVLVVGGVGALLFPTCAGRVAGSLWTFFILLPSLLTRATWHSALKQRYAQAARLARMVCWLHPADGWRESPGVYHALALAQSGQREEAAVLLSGFLARPGLPGAVAAAARIHLFRLRGQWEELLAWTEGVASEGKNGLGDDGKKAGRSSLLLDPNVLLTRVRAFGETGRLSEMFAAFQMARAKLERLPYPNFWPSCQLTLLAFGGSEAGTARLLDGPLAALPPEAKAFWRATARMAAGQPEVARADLRELAARSQDEDLRQAVRRRLSCDLADASRTLSAADRAALVRIEAESRRDMAYHPQPAAGLRRAYVTLALLALNLGMFAAETLQGGSENIETLLRLGAMWPPAVLEAGEWHRLVAALFLHLGPLHLGMNLLGLALIGPWVERTLGRARFAAVYLVSGVGSMAAVLEFIRRGWMPEEVLVGASGAIMGLIGATGALLLAGWRRERSGLAARRLRGVALVVALQAAFDLLTPQVSFAAHAAGALIGFLFTALVTARSNRGSAPAR